MLALFLRILGFVRPKEMAKAAKSPPPEREGFSVRFNLPGLAIFSMALIVAAGGLAFLLTQSLVVKANGKATSVTHAAESDPVPATPPAWGELVTYDIEIENPEEYMATDYDTNRAPMWVFDQPGMAEAKETLRSCGLSPAQVEQALSPSLVTVTATNIIVKPESELVFALPAEVRGKLYALLARNPANLYMFFPACFPANSFDLTMRDTALSPEVVAMVKRLLYRRGEAQYFSDFEAVMQRVPASEERLLLLKALTRQPGVLARMRIRPTTDVDKVLGYWTQAPGVRSKDLRPLLESLKRLPDGGTVSLVYFLPPFARERLYTYPLPPRAGEPAMDCHWSSLNFFNEQPEARFGDPGYAGAFLSKNYYPVQKPSVYGDVIVLTDAKNNGVHSAVYIADDIVFTKNGNNHLQPWMLMRLNKLVAKYASKGAVHTTVYRHRDS
jgi:hypothetical protein